MIAPKIYLVHAGLMSISPMEKAFRSAWSDVNPINLLDESLSKDAAVIGPNHAVFRRRFELIGEYCEVSSADALLFTCSAFGDSISLVKKRHTFPVLTPNEALFERILDADGRTAVFVTFEASVTALEDELAAMAEARGMEAKADFIFIPGAFNSPDHDNKVTVACGQLEGDYSAIALGQASMATAAEAVKAVTTLPVLDTPTTSVEKLRTLFTAT